MGKRPIRMNREVELCAIVLRLCSARSLRVDLANAPGGGLALGFVSAAEAARAVALLRRVLQRLARRAGVDTMPAAR